MPIKGQSKKEIMHTEMHKFKHGTLHSGSKHGPLVKSRKQAIAIGLSESGQSKYARGGASQDIDYVDDKEIATNPEPTQRGTVPRPLQNYLKAGPQWGRVPFQTNPIPGGPGINQPPDDDSIPKYDVGGALQPQQSMAPQGQQQPTPGIPLPPPNSPWGQGLQPYGMYPGMQQSQDSQGCCGGGDFGGFNPVSFGGYPSLGNGLNPLGLMQQGQNQWHAGPPGSQILQGFGNHGQTGTVTNPYADGGDVPDDTPGMPDDANRYPIGPGQSLLGAVTRPLTNFVRSTVDAAKTQPGSEEAHQAYGDVGRATGELGLSMIGGGKPQPGTAGVFLGPYGVHMLRQAGGDLTHPVYAKEVEQAVAGIHPALKAPVAGAMVDMRDALARQILESRKANNPVTGGYDKDIWPWSGWRQMPSGPPAKEVPDWHMQLEPTRWDEGGKPSEYMLRHPAGDLHQVYDVPPIKTMNMSPNVGAAVEDGTGQIFLNSNPKTKITEKGKKSMVLHEFQHRIDEKEGWPRGGAGSDAPDQTEVFKAPNGQVLRPVWWQGQKSNAPGLTFPNQKIDPSRGAELNSYMRNAGEVNARNVQGRYLKSFRYQAHPEDTQDVPPGLMIRNSPQAPRPQSEVNRQIGNPLEKWSQDEQIMSLVDRMGREGFDGGGGIKLKNSVPGIKGNFSAERAAGISLTRNARSGMINSAVPGRTDKLNMALPSGSYVIPADIPSALGEGNSMAGGNILNKMFNSGPYGMAQGQGPYGTAMGRLPHGNPRSHMGMPKMHFGHGGHSGRMTPIVAAGGEYVVHPEAVAKLGAGDINKGHDILDAFVKMVREKHIKTLKGLKPPKGSK